MSNEAILRGESTDVALEQIFWQDNLKEDAKSAAASSYHKPLLFLFSSTLLISHSVLAFFSIAISSSAS